MEQQPNIYRKMIAAAVSSVLLEHGFDAVETDSLGTLTEMMQAFISEIAFLTRSFCELSGRVEPVLGDVVLGFVEMGFNLNSLEHYVKSSKHSILPTLQPQQAQKQLNMLSAGSKQPLPPHIPQHFPPFPDPHAYVRTPTHKQPIIDYESVREKAAIQKRDIEKALTKFLAKTSTTHNLFDTDEANIFPLIACKPAYPPYLSALLPQDQIFDPEDLDIDPKSQILQQQKNHDKAKNQVKQDLKMEEGEQAQENLNESRISEDNMNNPNYIDNPYLAATKLPVGRNMEST
ncbi:transcription initiation factor TFIID subunit 8-like [Diorhabda carinulata]|uniref:transcription initiation factor TFIID subunit 8-like n=1 Tax=Diorhabda sublineata TaxID=1163346 RepID=UPI0024E111A6|nr:transcription initiation factor TFIID subunit 8-like [Diorhabda sublineata]XP_056647376.1 transcription initiation factor TFIID subunit 8-like [Diorhabda sublineata]XP_057663790.1 transcription initiation factor TFIID subunit 8-like [Diorhabda carinulata]